MVEVACVKRRLLANEVGKHAHDVRVSLRVGKRISNKVVEVVKYWRVEMEREQNRIGSMRIIDSIVSQPLCVS